MTWSRDINSLESKDTIVFEKDKKVYFIAETKSERQELRGYEEMKIHCGKKHFEKFDGVKFQAPVTKVSAIVI